MATTGWVEEEIAGDAVAVDVHPGGLALQEPMQGRGYWGWRAAALVGLGTSGVGVAMTKDSGRAGRGVISGRWR
jgi:hypothetical protein